MTLRPSCLCFQPAAPSLVHELRRLSRSRALSLTCTSSLIMAPNGNGYCLAVNCGSSSIKFKVYRSQTREVLVAGSASNVQGDSLAKFSFMHRKPEGDGSDALDQSVQRELDSSTSYQAVFEEILRDVTSSKVLGDGGKERITVIAHRIVHGGTAKQPVVIRHGAKDERETLEQMDQVSDFAPLHVSCG